MILSRGCRESPVARSARRARGTSRPSGSRHGGRGARSGRRGRRGRGLRRGLRDGRGHGIRGRDRRLLETHTEEASLLSGLIYPRATIHPVHWSDSLRSVLAVSNEVRLTPYPPRPAANARRPTRPDSGVFRRTSPWVSAPAMDGRNEMTEDRGAPAHRAQRLKGRWLRRAAVAAALGVGVGAIVGYALGIAAFARGSRGFWAVLIACLIFSVLVAVLVASYSSLESPDPSQEPSQVDRPIRDRPGLTRNQREAPGGTADSATDPRGSPRTSD